MPDFKTLPIVDASLGLNIVFTTQPTGQRSILFSAGLTDAPAVFDGSPVDPARQEKITKAAEKITKYLGGIGCTAEPLGGPVNSEGVCLTISHARKSAADIEGFVEVAVGKLEGHKGDLAALFSRIDAKHADAARRADMDAPTEMVQLSPAELERLKMMAVGAKLLTDKGTNGMVVKAMGEDMRVAIGRAATMLVEQGMDREDVVKMDHNLLTKIGKGLEAERTKGLAEGKQSSIRL
ncbi:MAG: hypothetical protein EB060_04380 [Proteobacteria bacterium]|nr:hypothetical protein [Pseudomonadota bacterium]